MVNNNMINNGNGNGNMAKKNGNGYMRNNGNGNNSKKKKLVNVTRANLETLMSKNPDLSFFKAKSNKYNQPTLAISVKKKLPNSLSSHYNNNSSNINQLFPNPNSNNKYRVSSKILQMAKNGTLNKKNSNEVNMKENNVNMGKIKKNVKTLSNNVNTLSNKKPNTPNSNNPNTPNSNTPNSNNNNSNNNTPNSKSNNSNNNSAMTAGKVMYGGRSYSVRYGARGGRYILRGGSKMYF